MKTFGIRALTGGGHLMWRSVALVMICALMLACGNSHVSPSAPSTPAPSTPAPASPTGTFALLSTSPPSGATIPLPEGFFSLPLGNGWVQDLTLTLQFNYPASISNAMVVVVLWRGSAQCLVAEGLVLGKPYGGQFNYVGGSTVTVSGNSFTGATPCRAGGVRPLTTDRLQFLLMDANKPAESRGVFSQDVAMGWSFE